MSRVFFHGASLEDADREAWLRRNGYARPLSRAVSNALLLDRRLCFERFGRSPGGGVTMSVAPGHAVEGALFEAEDEALAARPARPCRGFSSMGRSGRTRPMRLSWRG